MEESNGKRTRTQLFKESHFKPRGRALILAGTLLLINMTGLWFMRVVAELDENVLLLAALLAAFTTVIVGTPLILFLSLGWFSRYNEFQNSLKGGALAAYLQRFWSPSLIHSLQDEGKLGQDAPGDRWRVCADENPILCERLFARIYHEQYGLVPFAVPFIILLAVVYAAAALVACNYVTQNCLSTFQIACLYDLDHSLVVSSLAGAFMFVVSDSVLSIRRKSLNTSDVYWYSLRLFLAIPLALVIANAGRGDGAHIVTAFALGTLPVDSLMKIVRRMGFPQITRQEKQDGSSDKLLVLEGVTLPVVATLEAEGISSIEQVATADPVLLSIRTGFPFRFTLRLGSQAIVRRHLGENAARLLPVGLADVVPVYLLVQALTAGPSMDSPGFPLIETPDLIVENAAARLFPSEDDAQRQAVTKMKFRQIAAEEYTAMLARITPPDIGL
ncbi:hypothetical protein [Pseudomonas batumici]|uniref:Putative transmembrane protein n=1 Tax=Pseudomonas batumici TaxID=226910 RepID=A0A0C2IDT9_9PSED|nr:hypothetical protein [Pseudomonas batumici]KIH83117.1 putative transmembrane protein [Pseudomonas batumici]